MADDLRQRAFDLVVVGIRRQGKRSVGEDERGRQVCLYRTKDGLRCAAGMLISDELYRREMEKNPASFGVVKSAIVASLGTSDEEYETSGTSQLVWELQWIHDTCGAAGFIEEFEERARVVAASRGLTFPPDAAGRP